MTRKRRHFQFSIASLLVTMVVVSLALAFWRVNPTVFWASLIATVAANVLGVAVAWCITLTYSHLNL